LEVVTDEGTQTRVSRLLRRVEHLAERIRRPAPGPLRSAILLAAVVFFAGGVALAAAHFPSEHGHPRWVLLVLVATIGPCGFTACNVAEYRLTARLAGHSVTWSHALRIAVLGSAANLLPLPGAMLVRTRALAGMGSTYGAALGSTLTVGLIWLGTASALAGTFQLGGAHRAIGAGVGAAGLVVLGIAFRILTRRRPGAEGARLMIRLVIVEAVLTAFAALRIYLVILGFGFHVTPPQAVALTLAGVLATVTGVVPGGLGVREGLSAAIGPLVGLPASVSLLAAAFERLADLTVVGIAATVILTLDHRRGRSVPPPDSAPAS
jgi:uncharacterized membrane protein YbhN (UPF0104 family)